MSIESQLASLAGDATDFIRRVPLVPILPAPGRATLPRSPDLFAAPSEDEFNSLALRLFQFQFDSVLPYRRFCETRGCVPSTVSRWEEIPSLPVAAFKEFDVSCLPSSCRTRVFHSSGTTGRETSRHFHSAVSLGVYEASLRRWFAARFLPEGSEHAARLRFLSLTPPGALAPHSSLVHMFETVARSFPWSSQCFAAGVDAGASWRLDLSRARESLEASARTGLPTVVVGTAFSFVHLLEALDQEGSGLVLPPGSLALETGGYKGKSRELSKEELYDWMSRALGLDRRQIIGEYGMSELGSQACDRLAEQPAKTGAARRFHFPPWARARVISPETGHPARSGEPGLLAVLDLANAASCIALQTEDLAKADDAGFTILGRVPRALPRGCSLLPA